MMNYEYILLYFSGHGSQKRSLELYINQNEFINENDLLFLANKQLTIFDCCRATLAEGLNDIILKEKNILSALQLSYRRKYEERISKSINQQMILYSCSEGEYSYDTSRGGIYTLNLLTSLNNNNAEYITACEAHCQASEFTKYASPNQNPDYYMAKLPIEKQLILGVNLLTTDSLEFY